MKMTSILVLMFVFIQTSFSQQEITGHKGEFYFYWGWNQSTYTSSDITFEGDNYGFTLNDVIAKDRQSPFSVDKYLNPANMTIPQYNFRIGYFFNDHYNISIGTDHMKYVMQADQTVEINGQISNSGTDYDGVYTNENIVLLEDFLQYEHTDGLNYPNIELRRLDEIKAWKNIKINLMEGIGFGVLYPRTNTTLLNNDRYDQFHLSGYGIGAVVGLNVSLFKHLFLQSELKGGFINMPNVRTTMSESDSANQRFFFAQWNYVIGARFDLKKK